MIKYDMICLEGIDKTCKDLIAAVICKLTNFKYIFVGRGLISIIAYAKKFGRDYEYNLENMKHTLFVHLKTEKLDWEIRCKQSNEQPINFEEDTALFDETIAELKHKLGDDLKIIEFNVSHTAIFDIAVEISKYIEKLNSQD